MANGLYLCSGCDYFATADSELVIYNSRDNQTVMLDGVLAILLQIIRNNDVDCVLSKSKLHKLLQKEHVEFDDASLSIWIDRLMDLQLICNSDK